MNDIQRDKLGMLDNLYNTFGDYYLFHMKNNTTPTWPKWLLYTQCNESEKLNANLRSIFKCELVLDLEDPSYIDEILNILDNIPINYQCFSTGSRGYHTHIIFSAFNSMQDNEVAAIKKAIMVHFGCDISKKSAKNLLAIEYEPHFKTGNPKTLFKICNKYADNNLNTFLAMTIELSDLCKRNNKFNEVYSQENGWTPYFPSRSEAEQYLCTVLVSAGFGSQIISLIMNNSKTDKWKTKTDTYKQMTIDKAINFISNSPTATREDIKIAIDENNTEPVEPLFRWFEEYGIPGPVEWLVPDYIPARGVTIISGQTGHGKSMLVEEMISASLNKRKLFQMLDICIDNRPIVLIDMENDHATLYERLQKLGGVPAKQLMTFDFNRNFDVENKNAVAELIDIVGRLNPSFVVFDTLRRTFSGNENDSEIVNNVYKKVLAPISKDRCCMIIVHKRKGQNNLNKEVEDEIADVRGTGDITGLASAVLQLKKNIDDTVQIKPLKLRPAKLGTAFTVKLNTMSNGNLIYEWLGSASTLRSQGELGADKLLDWLKHNRANEQLLQTKDMINAMHSEGMTRQRVTEAIFILKNRGFLAQEKKGWYKIIYGQTKLEGL